MIHLFCFVTRRPDLSSEAFSAHWRDRHGPLIRDLPRLARHLRRYEQNPRLDKDAERGSSPGFDGVAHQIFDAHDDFIKFVKEPDYQEHVRADEQRFLDMGSLSFLLTEAPRVLIEGDRERAAVKLISFVRRKRGVERDAFHRWWSEERAARMRDDPDLFDLVIAHHQYQRTERDYERDGGGGFDGATEQWFPSLASLRTYSAQQAMKSALADAATSLLDLGTTQWIATGNEIVVLG
ncbi:MAG: EthD family reductase [Myxococcales bacterium]|nr:EthD family reductase [Myxococcales bacterium]